MTARAVAVAAVALLLAAGCDGPDRDASAKDPRRPDVANTSASSSECYTAPRAAADRGPVRFGGVTADLGVEQALTGMMAHAVAAGDVNGDGWIDLFIGTFADRPAADYAERGAPGPAPDVLLLGGQDGFRRDPEFPGARGRTSGAAFADLDADGDLDLVIARNHRDGPSGSAPSVIIENEDGLLRRVHELDRSRGLRSVGVLDYDGDGALDLFLVEDRFSRGSSLLLRNEGGLRFTDATKAAGLPVDVEGLGVAAADLNGDGRADLFVAGSNRLFVNRGGQFEEGADEEFEWVMYGEEDDPAGVAVGDVNRDGRPDLLVGQHFNSTLDDGRRVPVRLYLNEGEDESSMPRFRDVTEAAGLAGLPTKAPHVEVVDVDADGWPDILTSASAEGGARPAVFRNRGVSDRLPRFDPPAGVGDAQYWVAGTTFDADHDGRLDVFLAEFDPAQPSLLLRNETSAGHWLDVQVGPAGTRGVGANVEIFEAGRAGEAAARLGSIEIGAAVGYGSGTSPMARFGLGDVRSVDVVVHPAGGGDADVVSRAEADRLLQVGAHSAC